VTAGDGDTANKAPDDGITGRDERMKLYIPLRTEEMARLVALAREERRRPQDQAALIIARALAEEPNEKPQALEPA